MNRLRSKLVEQLPQTVAERQTNNHLADEDDDTFIAETLDNDHHASIRRRAPTRHSIKSLTGRKTLSKQNSTNEVNIFLIFVLYRLNRIGNIYIYLYFISYAVKINSYLNDRCSDCCRLTIIILLFFYKQKDWQFLFLIRSISRFFFFFLRDL